MNEPAKGLRVALAQINPTVGDIDGNAELIAEWIERARDAGRRSGRLPGALPARLSGRGPLPEAALRRAPTSPRSSALARASRRDRRAGRVRRARRRPRRRAAATAPAPRPVHNSLALLADGEIAAVYRKNRLPNYGVFDEVRYFEPGTEPLVCEVDGVAVGLTICEDLWEPGPPAIARGRGGRAS